MLITILDEQNHQIADAIMTAALGQGHLVKQVIESGHTTESFSPDPGIVVIGAGRVDGTVIERVVRLRRRYPQALILLVANNATSSEMMLAIEQGATHVLHEPLHPREMVNWLVRISEYQGQARRVHRVADLEVNTDQMRVAKAGRELRVTPQEFHLLSRLAEHPGRVVSVGRLLTLDNGIDEIAHSSLKSHISRLRQKLHAAGGVPLRIGVRQQLGYVLEEKSDDVEPGEVAPVRAISAASVLRTRSA